MAKGFLNYKKEHLKFEDGSDIWVFELSAKAMLLYNEKLEELKKDYENLDDLPTVYKLRLMTLLVLYSASEDGKVLAFSEEQIPELENLPFNKLNQVSETALKLSGFNVDKAKEVAANLKNDQNDSSTTD
jgi:hypothetical protein